MKTVSYDYIVVGAGAAGLSSAQYAARSGLCTLVLDISEPGGQALHIVELENYPGVFPKVRGEDFVASLKTQAQAFGAQVLQAHVTAVDKIGTLFHVRTRGEDYTSYAVLIATGAEHKTLGIPGEKELNGRGVSYCAVCDGPFFRGKKIVVVGGGDSACSEALYLATLSSHVTLIHRRMQFRAEHALAERVQKNESITIRFNTIIKEIRGSGRVQSVLIEDVASGAQSELPADAVFIFVGMKARTELFDMLPKDALGCIVTNEKMETVVTGLYCAGDVRAKEFRQIVTAAADGAIAAHFAAEYVRTLAAGEHV
ncbi:MAG: thioredoxin-disulfide reductase [Treponema sp.]|nr:thioredoxin-disulfide reductase [Treponema sp.]